MADEPENHTLRLLQEMRTEMRERFDVLETKVDGNAILLNMLAGMIGDHEERIETLEGTGDKP